jgi:RimJ/RimL family protein N-acetyltransferase
MIASEKPDASTTVLETERLRIRKLVVDDAPLVLELLNDPSFIRFIGDRGIRTLEDARDYVENGAIASYDQLGFGMYLVALRADDTPIGICGLLKREALDDVDVGYALLPRFWSRGYAVEAAGSVIEYAKRAFGLRRVAAITRADNVASIRVLEKLGMRFERMVKLSEESPEVQLFARDT